MDKKKIIIIIMGILLVGIAIAFIPGDSFTSEEFKEKDIETEYFCSYIDAGAFGNNIEFFFECRVVNRQSANNWTVDSFNHIIYYPLEDFNDCLGRLNRGRCLDEEVKPIVLNEIRITVESLREDTIWKQREASGKVVEDNEITFTDEEINL